MGIYATKLRGYVLPVSEGDHTRATHTVWTPSGVYSNWLSPNVDCQDFTGEDIVTDAASSGYGGSERHYGQCLSEGSSNTGLNTEDKRILIRNFNYLKKELEPEPIMHRYIRDRDMTIDCFEEIKLEGTRSARVDLLLRKICRFRRSDALSRFLDYLNETAVNQVHIRQRLTEISTLPELIATSLSQPVMENILNVYHDVLLHEMEPNEIACYFLMYEELTVDEYEAVTQKFNTRRKKCEILLTFIRHKLPRSYRILLTSLQGIERTDLVSRLQLTDGLATLPERPIQRNISAQLNKQGSRKILKQILETPQYKLKIEFEKKDVNEEHSVVDVLNTAEISLKVNNNLIVGTKCFFLEAEHGSIILHLKTCGETLRRHLIQQGTVKQLVEIIRIIIGNNKVTRLFREEEVKFSVMIQPDEDDIERHYSAAPRSYKEIVRANKDLLQEEINAVTLCDVLMGDNVLTHEEVEDILGSDSRQTRTRILLDKMLTKEDEELQSFFNALRQYKSFVHDLIFPSPDDASFCVAYIATNLEQFYSELLDNISPSLVTNACQGLVVRTDDDTGVVLPSNGARKHRSQVLLQYVIRQDGETRLKFVQILHSYGQIPHSVFMTVNSEINSGRFKEPTGKAETIATLEEYNLGTFTLKRKKVQTKRWWILESLKKLRDTSFKRFVTTKPRSHSAPADYLYMSDNDSGCGRLSNYGSF